MRINKNINHTKRNLILAAAISLIVLSIGGAWYYLNISSTKELRENVVNYEPATDEQQSSGLKAKEDFNNTYYGKDDNNSSVDTKKDVGVLISSMNQNGTLLTIATSVESLDVDGVCELKLSRDGSDMVTAQVKTFQMTTYSACEDFNIDVAGLEKTEWSAQVDYIGSSTKGTTTAKVVIK